MPTIRISDDRWKKLEMMAVEETIRIKKPVTVTDIVRNLIDHATKNQEKTIKIIHKPEQKGDLTDYFIAICDGEIADGETEELAKKNLFKKLKEIN